MPETQNYKNHTRWFPGFHFFAAPVLMLNVIAAIIMAVHFWPHHRLAFLWNIVVALALATLAMCSRIMALKAQDRVIRLEERLRFAGLLPPDLLARSQSLTLRQYVGLRFASDAEVAGLVQRALDQNLSEKQIKEAIQNWRGDYYRV